MFSCDNIEIASTLSGNLIVHLEGWQNENWNQFCDIKCIEKQP